MPVHPAAREVGLKGITAFEGERSSPKTESYRASGGSRTHLVDLPGRTGWWVSSG